MGNKIQILLAQAKRESESDSPEKSSVSFATRETADDSENHKLFGYLKEKLFHIEKWNAESGISNFVLFDQNGTPAPEKRAAAGDFIKISLPASGKDDWVKIIEIYEMPEEIVLTVQPTFDPTSKEDDKNRTSHFFTSEATNNFCLEKQENKVNIYVIGLSEKPNTEDTSGILETIRNYATANLGHYFGIQEGEWTTFCKNFLKIETDK